jgi:glycosyltransferase involved in cell wall biosynthesis
MEIAFYAPMKPPDHPVPSGDRTIARLLLRALRRAGHRVTVAAGPRSHDATGDPVRQQRIRVAGRLAAKRFLNQARNRSRHPPDLWFTYHLYRKAPDWMGPSITRDLGIPYIVADASIAPGKADGPWAEGHRATARAIAQARRVIAFDPVDMPCLETATPVPSRLVTMPPFVPVSERLPGNRAKGRESLATTHGLDPRLPWIVVAAMMRPGAKLESYRVLAQAMAVIADQPCVLLVAGGGPARVAVEALFTKDERAVFLGRLDANVLARLHRAADLAAWPAMGESIGMSVLEAQALGCPVVAGARPGLCQAVVHGETGLLAPCDDPRAFAAALATLLGAPERRQTMGRAAHARMRRDHSLESAAARLDSILHAACAETGP